MNNPHNQLRPEAATLLNSLIKRLKVAIPLLILVHKGLFYSFGRYYSLGKRIAAVDYAKVIISDRNVDERELIFIEKLTMFFSAGSRPKSHGWRKLGSAPPRRCDALPVRVALLAEQQKRRDERE